MTTTGIFALLDLQSSSQIEKPIESIRQGIPVRAAFQLAQRFKIPENKLATLIGITPRTLARYKKKHQPLQSISSDRLYRLARVIALAEEVLEEEATARNWLHRPNQALGGIAPLELLDTDAGTQQVSELLNRIEYSVYS